VRPFCNCAALLLEAPREAIRRFRQRFYRYTTTRCVSISGAKAAGLGMTAGISAPARLQGFLDSRQSEEGTACATKTHEGVWRGRS
jgi:hypothetical protein